MMQTPLTVGSLLERAEKFFAKKQVISQTHDKLHTLTYTEIGKRTRKLMSVLAELGVQKGDRVGTLAWNHHRHLEIYFAAPGIGSVLHTINIRLSPEHIIYIINHAEDKVLLIDEDILPLIEKIQGQLKTVEAFVVMTDKAELPESSLHPLYSYEELLHTGDPAFPFAADINENDPAGMCYTSATTGKPKGVLYTHRGIVLHSFALGLADTAAISESDVSMAVVPQFHVNAWGTPFACTWFGSTQVMPGPRFTPKRLAEFIEKFKVTITAGVPTIWLGLLKELEQGNYDTSSLRAVLCGGAAAPKGLIQAFEKKYKIPFYHAYGATETTPLVTFSRLKSYQQDLSDDEKLEERSRQGILVPGLEMKIIGNDGEVAWDNQEMGELCLRGPWIASEYYKDERSENAFTDGWFHTGDVVTVDEEGTIKIVDRTKDLIKSGGEWISSVELENALMAHDAVFEASVIAIPDKKWQERPIACVVLHEGYRDSVGKAELLEFLRPQFAKFWVPDDILFFDEIPKTSVGKFLKRQLREQVKEHYSLQQ
ncbi:long-chain-fatty-acid--CoA ligase [Virgibacillus dakarensis]|uniref:Long-chain-fatty-acid--CoA ligase n=1 Tax=Lentibacillus populi TaxID=1827502 RepID=A0A9W5X4T5_9BACI|nr:MULTISPECIES: long-chain fatty acid--CoA ligase [Bacillaceae]MBT2217321.1 long-chain fatty acid--CoA ligase [Virgibacillus dakarensis]MTW86745.1 long-chain-fatty-acid--CoA ligase [Virgibacillus dakarensis]GGB38055.1 long-chain-fatty-acid--CoA ligase [Lentibacillus populi]